MSSLTYLLLVALLLTDSVVYGRWPRSERGAMRGGSLGHRSQRQSRNRYLTSDMAQGRSNRIQTSASKSDTSNGYNSIDGEPSQNVCSASESMQMFCKESTFSELIAEYNLKYGFNARPTSPDFMVDKRTALTSQKRTRVSSCDCRRKPRDFATGKPIYLGSDHFPQYLPSNVTCDHSRCSDSTTCEPTPYQIKVLVKRKTDSDRLDDELPMELRRCWRTKVYTVYTDCMCVYEP